jgi:hypothetical protein
MGNGNEARFGKGDSNVIGSRPGNAVFAAPWERDDNRYRITKRAS